MTNEELVLLRDYLQSGNLVLKRGRELLDALIAQTVKADELLKAAGLLRGPVKPGPLRLVKPLEENSLVPPE